MDAEDRRELDRAILSTVLPGFTERESDGTWEVTGLLRIQLKDSEPRAVPIRLAFPSGYPTYEPYVFDAAGTFAHLRDRHFMGDQACLWFIVESRWDPTDDRALEPFLDQVALFFARQILWDAGYGWLGGERPHGWERAGREVVPEMLGVEPAQVADFIDAFVGRLREDKPCPCRSGRPYWVCHREAVRQVLDRFPGEPLAAVVGGLWIEARIQKVGEAFIQQTEPGLLATIIPECRDLHPGGDGVATAVREKEPDDRSLGIA